MSYKKKLCAVCKNEFLPTSPTQVYCSSCGKLVFAARRKTARRNKRWKDNPRLVLVGGQKPKLGGYNPKIGAPFDDSYDPVNKDELLSSSNLHKLSKERIAESEKMFACIDKTNRNISDKKRAIIDTYIEIAIKTGKKWDFYRKKWTKS